MNRGIERRVWTLTLNILVISKDWTTPELDGYLTTYSGWLQGGGITSHRPICAEKLPT